MCEEAPSTTPQEMMVHGSAVALAGRGVLITGASGAGKSSLALDLISRGAALISDDQTRLWRDGGEVIAGAPAPISGRIEARGVGILRAPVASPCKLALIVDLDCVQTRRLPDTDSADLLDVAIPRICHSDMTCFPAAIHLYLSFGRSE